jgi:hypothetical protein
MPEYYKGSKWPYHFFLLLLAPRSSFLFERPSFSSLVVRRRGRSFWNDDGLKTFLRGVRYPFLLGWLSGKRSISLIVFLLIKLITLIFIIILIFLGLLHIVRWRGSMTRWLMSPFSDAVKEQKGFLPFSPEAALSYWTHKRKCTFKTRVYNKLCKRIKF